ncbi:organic cation transporter protein-like [Branchiostoma lanceolatum]|uniref:organic cation transporter protein-like n=1 Tax=Branchiostoma lanceolatum TaxID=7740 RepID=UPI003455C838
MEMDNLLRKYLGEFGRFQKSTALLAILVGPTFGMSLVAMTFLAATPEHHCRVFGNASSAGHRYRAEDYNSSVPLENIGGTWKRSSCLMYKESNSTTTPGNETTACTHGWEYDRTIYQTTIVTEVDDPARGKVGDKRSRAKAGRPPAWFGRRPTTVLCLLLHLALSTGASFTSDYVSFVVLRALDGAAANGLYFTAFVLAIEVVGPSKRNAVGMAVTLSFGVGFFVLCLLAYFLRTWRNLQLVQGLIMTPLLCYWWVLPESPRWLISNKRVKSARDVLRRAARVNDVTIPDDVCTSLLTKSAESKEEKKRFSMIDLVQTPRMRKITLTVCFVWMFIAGVYFGLIVGTTDLAGDPYVNFALGTALELGLTLLGWAAMERCGRKPVIAGSALLAGIGCLASAATTELPTVSRDFALVGRVVIGITFNCLIAYSPDVFPTVVRGMGMGAVTAFSRVGTMLAPFVTLLGDVWLPLPMLTFGVASCAGGLSVCLLPETLGLPLPETIEDVEDSGRKPQRKEKDKSVSYTNPWPKRDPFSLR